MKILLPLLALGALSSCRSNEPIAADPAAASEARPPSEVPEPIEAIEQVADAPVPPEVPDASVEAVTAATALPEIRYFMIADT